MTTANESTFTVCQACQETIAGPSVTCRGLFFHTECFSCVCCQNLIPLDARFGVRVSIPYCEECFIALSTISQAAAKAANSRHSSPGKSPIKKENNSFAEGLRSSYSCSHRIDSEDESNSVPASDSEQLTTPHLKDGWNDPVFTAKTRPRSSTSISKSKVIDNHEIPENPDDALSNSRLKRTETTLFVFEDLIWGEKLGQGFFGSVYKAKHRISQTEMAVKEMKKQDDAGARRTFKKEVTLLKRMKHPNILRFIGVFCKVSGLFLITEFIGGGTLRQFIKNKPEAQFCWKQRIQFALGIARGMAYLHKHLVIHRDLTSKNILIREDLTPCVADFGLAKPLSRSRKQNLTVAGSPYWMAPEMMKGKEYNQMADIFSYGIILGEMAARIKANPDVFPRLNNFGVDFPKLKELCSNHMPPDYFVLLTRHCDLVVENRPVFTDTVVILENILMNYGKLPRSQSLTGSKGNELSLIISESSSSEKFPEKDKGMNLTELSKGVTPRERLKQHSVPAKRSSNPNLDRLIFQRMSIIGTDQNISFSDVDSDFECNSPDDLLLDFEDQFFTHDVISSSPPSSGTEEIVSPSLRSQYNVNRHKYHRKSITAITISGKSKLNS